MTQPAASTSASQTTSTPSFTAAFRAAILDRLPFLRTLPKSMLLAGAAALVVALAAVAILWSRAPEYKVLFTNLDERDGGAIVTALTQMNVPYRFSDQGGALLVPADRVHETRLQLAGQGLPRGGSVGFELLDNARFGASQFSEQITWQRGLEGELARSIETMHHVQQARVHLAMPRQTLFVRDRQTPTASVLLNLYPGRTLTDTQVSSVAWLVAASVPGLDTEHVSIVDQNGRLLSAPGSQATGMDSEQLRYVRDIEQHTVEHILTLLNPLLGPNNVHAQATAQVDFSHTEQTSESYRPNQEPGQAAVRSQQTSQASERDTLPAQGIPGALSNQPPTNATAPLVNPPGAAAAPMPAQAPSVNERRDATINYEVDRTIRHIKQSTGTLQRLSVAVVLNWRPNADGEMQPLPPEELEKLEKLVREAMGYSEVRGDSLNLTNSRFTDPEPAVPFWREAGMVELAKDILGYLLWATLLFWLWRAVLKPIVRRHTQPAVEPAAVPDETATDSADAAAASRERYQDTLAAVREMVRKDPRVVAMVLNDWMEKDAK